MTQEPFPSVPLRRAVASLDNGAWGEEPDGTPLSVFCLRAADFNYQSLRVSAHRAPLRRITTQQKRRLLLQKGDLVLEKSGGGDHLPVGRAVLFDLDVEAVSSNFAARLRPTADVEPRYLCFVLAYLFSQGATARCIKQTTGIQNLDTQAWLQTAIPMPPLSLQRQIADFLDAQAGLIDQAISLRERHAALAQEQQRAAVLRAVTGQGRGAVVRPENLPWAEAVAEGWMVTKIVHHARLGSGHTPSRSNPEWWVNCQIPWITTGEVAQIRDDRQEVLLDTRERLSFRGIANSSAEVHPQGTVVLSRTASAGFSAVMGKDMATSQDFVTWTCSGTLDPFYLLWCLRAMRPDLLGRLAMGSTHKTIYVPDIQGIRIPVPPVDLQREVVRGVREIRSRFDDVADLQARQVALLRERKQALITAAVTGQFDVSTASARSVA